MEEDSQNSQETSDFDFSVEKIEEAANTAVSSVSVQSQEDTDRINQAAQYLQKWESNPLAIFQACEVIRVSENLNAHFFAAQTLDFCIPTSWEKIKTEDRVEVRTFICQQIITYESTLIIEKLSKALAHIAVFDFPKDWEAYDTYLFPDNESPVTFLMLEAFFIDFDKSDKITEQRRQQIRNELTRKIDYFIPRIQAAMQNPEMSSNALNTYNAMVKWAPRSAIRIDFIDPLFNKYLINDDTYKVAVQCLKKIFLQRNDSHSLFVEYIHSVIELFATVKLESGQSVTVLPEVLKLVISLLYKYMMQIEKMVIQSGSATVKEQFDFLVTTTLSVREELPTIPNKLWLTWFDILERIQKQSWDQMPLKYSTELFKPMFQTIIQNLYEMLPYSVDDDGILKMQAQRCFAKLVEVDYQAICSFLEPQTASASLSYSLGCLMIVRAPKQDMTSFGQVVEFLFRVSQDKIDEGDADYIIALMFGFSRSASFLSELGNFDKFLEIAINCIQSPSRAMYNSASQALLYIARNRPNLFFADDTKIILISLIKMSDYYVNHLPETCAKTMFECLLILIAQMDEPDRFKELFQPVVTALSNPDVQPPLVTSLYIISNLAKEKTNIPRKTEEKSDGEQSATVEFYFGQSFAEFVSEQIFDLARQVIVAPNATSDDIELLLEALSSLIGCIETYQDAEEPIKEVLALFFNRGNILPCFFTFITSLRVKFNKNTDMNELFQPIMESFVYPIIPEDSAAVPDDAPLAEILEMISKFKHAQTNVEWVVNVSLNKGLESYDKDVNHAATKAVYRVFSEMETDDLRSLFMDVGVQVFTAIFQALGDSMHKPSSRAIIKLIYKVCRLIMDGVQFPDELREFIGKALEEVFKNNEQDIFNKFIDFLAGVLSDTSNNFNQFEEGVLNFLIMQNKYSPGDASAFKLYKKKSYLNNDFGWGFSF